MFDKLFINGGGSTHHHSSTVRVTEQRAPTDESVRLLREMEDKVLEQVVDGFLTRGNTVELLGLQFGLDAFGREKLYYAFKLNGQTYRGTIEDVVDVRARFGDQQEMLRLVVEKFAQVLVRELLSGAGAELTRWTRG